MVVTNKPLFWINPQGQREEPSGFVHVTVVDSTCVFDDGQVMSVQPNGTVERRVAGTTGEYEVFQRAGEKIVYKPLGNYHAFGCIDVD